MVGEHLVMLQYVHLSVCLNSISQHSPATNLPKPTHSTRYVRCGRLNNHRWGNIISPPPCYAEEILVGE